MIQTVRDLQSAKTILTTQHKFMYRDVLVSQIIENSEFTQAFTVRLPQFANRQFDLDDAITTIDKYRTPKPFPFGSKEVHICWHNGWMVPVTDYGQLVMDFWSAHRRVFKHQTENLFKISKRS